MEGAFIVIVETEEIDQLWMYAGEWVDVSEDFPPEMVRINYIAALGEYGVLAHIELEGEEGNETTLLWFTPEDGWMDIGESAFDDLQIIDSMFLEAEGMQVLLLITYNPATEEYAVAGSLGYLWQEVYSTEYKIHDVALFNQAFYIIQDGPTGLQVLKFFMNTSVVLENLGPTITHGRFAESEDALFIAFSKANSGGAAELYASSDGDSWQYLRHVVGNGATEAELAWVSDFVVMDQKLLLATA